MNEKFIGRWGGLGEKIPVWEINKDSIFYFERSTYYHYKLNNNNMEIDFPEGKGTLKNIRVIKDTLFFLDEGGEIVYAYRFKSKVN